MSPFQLVPLDTSDDRARELLGSVKTKMGAVPNMMRAMAQAPAVLDAYLQMSGALAKATLSAKTREQIALAVGQASGCEYCLAAHSLIGQRAGLTPEQIRAARQGASADPGTAAILSFARSLVERRGWVSPDDRAAMTAAGHGESTLVEVVGVVALNLFTNYFNHVSQVPVDFPAAPPL